MTARILTYTPDEYFAGKGADRPYLTQSVAARLVNQSPLHAWTYHPKLGGLRSTSTDAMREGDLIHALLLGKGKKFEVLDYDEFRTKEAKEARDNAIFHGLLPVKRKDFEPIAEAADALRGKLAEVGITLDGISELAVEWEEQGESGPILCRAMMDNVVIANGEIIDLKKCVSAHPRLCGKHMVEYGYDIQSAAYPRAIGALYPDLVGRINMRFAFMELEPPYAVCALPLSGSMKALGEAKWERALKIWERCLATGVWPGYPTEGQIEPLPYQMEGLIGE